jgi:TolB-like protein/tetratricopeptide (TPR) repeat protein
MSPLSGRVTFGPFELDLDTGELWKSGVCLRLQPQPATVLCLLVRAAGALVSRDEIRNRLWGDSTFVDYDTGLDYCVNRIRAALGDSAQAPRYVETLPRRGYRFIAPVVRQRPFVEPTLAVLPFANLNADPEKDYFADGVTDALIMELARIPALRVLSRQSILHLKGSRRTVAEIARDLGVDGVVEGAALHEGSRVRLTAQLILVEPERHAWAQRYECDMSAVLSTQHEAALAIAASVAAVLRPGVVSPDFPPDVRGRAPAPEVVETFLKGASELGKASADSLQRALGHFREITLAAPDFAPGLTGHAATLFTLGWFGLAPAREVFPAAKVLALQAVALDDGASTARYGLATMLWLLDGDLAAAESEFRRALEQSPSLADGHTLYALFLSGTGRQGESIARAEYALKLGPGSLIQNQAAAWVYLHAGQYERAEAQARRTLALFPDSLQPQFVLGWAMWGQGRAADAVAAFEHALVISREALSLSFLAHAYGRLGRPEEARRLLEEIEQLLAGGRASPVVFVFVYTGLGDLDAAFHWLEMASRITIDLAWLTPGFPGVDPLRSDPRFERLVHRAGVSGGADGGRAS